MTVHVHRLDIALGSVRQKRKSYKEMGMHGRVIENARGDNDRSAHRFHGHTSLV